HIKTTFTKENRDLAIGGILNKTLSPEMQFVAFGNDWSSTFTYISKRKGFTVPGWFKRYHHVTTHPEKFVEPDRLGAVVACSVDHPNVAELFQWITTSPSSTGHAWKIGETHGCLIVTPEKTARTSKWEPIQCIGAIDKAETETRDGRQFLSLAGWTATSGEKPVVPDAVFLRISSPQSIPIYVQALKIPRLDVNKNFDIPQNSDAGFSRIVFTDLPPGDYEVEIIHYENDNYYTCGITKSIHI
ncbi:MAG: hypothetical protein P8104_12410, partial [Gammaproteobacteria bacterium]